MGKNKNKSERKERKRLEEDMCIVILGLKKINGILNPRKEEEECR